MPEKNESDKKLNLQFIFDEEVMSQEIIRWNYFIKG